MASRSRKVQGALTYASRRAIIFSDLIGQARRFTRFLVAQIANFFHGS